MPKISYLTLERKQKSSERILCLFSPTWLQLCKPKMVSLLAAGRIPNEPTHRKQIKLRDKHQYLFYPLSFPIVLRPALPSPLLSLTTADRNRIIGWWAPYIEANLTLLPHIHGMEYLLCLYFCSNFLLTLPSTLDSSYLTDSFFSFFHNMLHPVFEYFPEVFPLLAMSCFFEHSFQAWSGGFLPILYI